MVYFVGAQAAQRSGPLTAAPALAALFQVCSSWRAVSSSESLWRSLVISVWRQEISTESTWQDTYMRIHRTASNFFRCNTQHFTLEYEVSSNSSNGSDGGRNCRRLALSSEYIAGGFSDGTLCVFSLSSKDCVCKLKPIHENVIGPHSRNITGITLAADDDSVVFASMEGSLFVGDIVTESCRRAHVGNYVNDGILVDFTGSISRWVGLYAGVRGRALHVWDAYSEELLFNGGNMTDADAYAGWNMLVDNAEDIGRVRISKERLVVVATRSKLCVLDMETLSIVFNMPMARASQFLCASLALQEERILIVSANGIARILSSVSMQEMERFHIGAVAQGDMVHGALNGWHGFVCNNGVIDVWDISDARHLYGLAERLDDLNDLVANNEYVAACCGREEDIHLWDFTP